MSLELNNKLTAGIIIAMVALFSLIFLGFSGFKVLFGMMLVLFFPFYLIMDGFNLTLPEKIFFSFFIGLGIFPTAVYWLGVLVSFKLSVAICFVVFLAIGIIIKVFRKRVTKNKS